MELWREEMHKLNRSKFNFRDLLAQIQNAVESDKDPDAVLLDKLLSGNLRFGNNYAGAFYAKTPRINQSNFNRFRYSLKDIMKSSKLLDRSIKY